MKNMKKLICAVALLAIGTASVSAQNWLDALKNVAAEAVDKATDGKLTTMAIIGTWSYSQPGVRMSSSDNTLAALGGSAIASGVQSKLKPIYEKVGIKAGVCSITFKESGEFEFPIGSRTLNGTYTFDAQTHAITLSFSNALLKGLGSFKGYAYISGSGLQLVFSVDKLVSFVTKLGSKISALSQVTAMLEKYDDTYLGFEFAK